MNFDNSSMGSSEPQVFSKSISVPVAKYDLKIKNNKSKSKLKKVGELTGKNTPV